jgi:Domain of unknown function (DUF4082)
MKKITRKSLLGALGSTGIVLTLTGCGTGGRRNAFPLRMQIAWPTQENANATSRYLPPYAASVLVTVRDANGGVELTRIAVNRPSGGASTQDVNFGRLFVPGQYSIIAEARLGSGGAGAIVATATTPVTITNASVGVDITLATTLDHLEITGQPLSVVAGANKTIMGQAITKSGAVVLLPSGALTWEMVSGNAFGSVNSAGLFTGASAGTARVRLREVGLNIFAEADVTVTSSGGGGLPPGTSHTWTSASTTNDISKSSIGFLFTPNTNITVTELGYYDDNGDGLAIDHPVALFDTGGTRLVETTVRAGTVDTLRGKFRYRSITPVNLAAGTAYVLAGFHDSASGDVFAYGNIGGSITGFVADSRLIIGGNGSRYLYYGGGTPLPFPTDTIGYTFYAGPSLFIA